MCSKPYFLEGFRIMTPSNALLKRLDVVAKGFEVFAKNDRSKPFQKVLEVATLIAKKEKCKNLVEEDADDGGMYSLDINPAVPVDRIVEMRGENWVEILCRSDRGFNQICEKYLELASEEVRPNDALELLSEALWDHFWNVIGDEISGDYFSDTYDEMRATCKDEDSYSRDPYAYYGVSKRDFLASEPQPEKVRIMPRDLTPKDRVILTRLASSAQGQIRRAIASVLSGNFQKVARNQYDVFKDVLSENLLRNSWEVDKIEIDFDLEVIEHPRLDVDVSAEVPLDPVKVSFELYVPVKFFEEAHEEELEYARKADPDDISLWPSDEYPYAIEEIIGDMSKEDLTKCLKDVLEYAEMEYDEQLYSENVFYYEYEDGRSVEFEIWANPFDWVVRRYSLNVLKTQSTPRIKNNKYVFNVKMELDANREASFKRYD